MKEQFIVKHAVSGAIYMDTKKQPIDYRVEPRGEGWLFTVKTAREPWVEEIVRMRSELNVFIFREFEDAPTVKTWYYISDGPVAYDEERQELTLAAQSKIEYVPDHFQS